MDLTVVHRVDCGDLAAKCLHAERCHRIANIAVLRSANSLDRVMASLPGCDLIVAKLAIARVLEKDTTHMTGNGQNVGLWDLSTAFRHQSRSMNVVA